jgi:endonuclease/exonuclease/phosphatase family metal-dependent hydrolase
MIDAGGPIRVMTWNIHGGVGLDRRCDLSRIADIVSRHAPDIVALQEVDSRARRVSNAFETLTDCLGGNCAEARLIEAPDGDYGHMLISRWPLSTVRVHSLSIDRREPRAAIEVNVETPWGRLHVVAAHLGLGLGERRRQARLLRALADEAPDCTVMLGDFNDWIRIGSVRRSLAAVLPARTPHRTFPSFAPMLKLDRIYCRPPGLLLSHRVDRDAWRASDHLPLIAELDPTMLCAAAGEGAGCDGASVRAA